MTKPRAFYDLIALDDGIRIYCGKVNCDWSEDLTFDRLRMASTSEALARADELIAQHWIEAKH